jgi:hypothetical protein
MKHKVKIGNGLLRQCDTFFLGERSKYSTIIIEDIGDNTVFVKKNLSKFNRLSLWSRKCKSPYISSEIISAPTGSIIYFKESLPNEFKKGNIYPVRLEYDIPITLSMLEDACKQIFQNIQVRSRRTY